MIHSVVLVNLQNQLGSCHLIYSYVMLLWNINISVGLVNGSIGTIKELIYDDNVKTPNLPQYLIIQFDDYTGPPFFTGEGQE